MAKRKRTRREKRAFNGQMKKLDKALDMDPNRAKLVFGRVERAFLKEVDVESKELSDAEVRAMIDKLFKENQ